VKNLALMSERRGKDSSGLCFYLPAEDEISVIKGPVTVSALFSDKSVKQTISKSLEKDKVKDCSFVFGHARLVTNGTQLNNLNNQPVSKDNIIAVHNGIITNDEELWLENEDIKRNYEIDTEIFLSLVRKEINAGSEIEKAVANSLSKVEGTVSMALTFTGYNKFVLVTNNGSLYYITDNSGFLIFASEKNTLLKIGEKFRVKEELRELKIHKVESNTGLSIDLSVFVLGKFSKYEYGKNDERFVKPKRVTEFDVLGNGKQINVVLDINQIKIDDSTKDERALLIYPIDKIKKLRRCTKCVLPETFPFINFDSKGVCNYCHNYRLKNQPKPKEDLLRLVEKYRSKDGSPDCIIPLSGGRDSTYVLHYAKRELGLNPITLTYDWGMVTDLARRNIARICGKLGVENIIVAADIHWKRKNIHDNVKAWLKRPELGMIPLFMSGDKYFYYYANKIKEENNIKLNILGINDLENTDFKVGFAGVSPRFDKERIYSMTLSDKVKLFSYVGSNFLKNPGYLNQSLLDSFGSIISRYFTHKNDYYHLFDYLKWDEKEVESTIIEEYNWERAIDTNSTWRIGDGTASFYNYIYTLVAGFSENDTFRSNMIREGMISREKALELVYEENNPRYNSIKWYLEIIDLNYKEVIKKINNIKPLY